MELAEKNSEDSLNPGWEILSRPPDDVARSRLSKPVVAKHSDSMPTEDEVLRVYSKYIRLFSIRG